MNKKTSNTEAILSLLNVLSPEEQWAVHQLVKAMAEAACKRETGHSIEEYNKALELAEAEPSQKHNDVINEISEWLSSKKKKAIA